uniref:Uncharacterized protein n=1 Tax=Anguilla anguilla TaxID=7936 RepID=A0A0E9WLV9_ANGAN
MCSQREKSSELCNPISDLFMVKSVFGSFFGEGGGVCGTRSVMVLYDEICLVPFSGKWGCCV